MQKKVKRDRKTETALNTWVKLARAFAAVDENLKGNIKKLGLSVPQFGVIY